MNTGGEGEGKRRGGREEGEGMGEQRRGGEGGFILPLPTRL